MYFAGLPAALPFIKLGRVKPLGLTAAKRAPALADVPTIAEAGVPGYEHSLEHAARPRRSAETDYRAAERYGGESARRPDVRERYAGMGVYPTPSTPERASAYLRSETEKYAKVVKAIGLRIE